MPMTHIQTQSRLPCDDVRRAGFRLNRAHRSNQTGSTQRPALDRPDPRGSGRQRVMAEIHRRRSSVIGVPHESELHPALAGYRFDDSKRSADVVEHRPLLNVEFHIAEDIVLVSHCSLRNFCRIQTKVLNRLAYRDSLRILAAEQIFIQTTHEGAAPDKRRAEANALLFRETDDFYGKVKLPAVQSDQQRNGKNHSEHAVVRSSVGYGIKMRANHQVWRICLRRRVKHAQIPYGIDP